MSHSFNSVIIVDDDDATNFLNKRIIKKINPDVEIKVFNESSHVMSYLENPENTSPDLMFLDINMPAHSGWEVINNMPVRHRDKLSIVVLSTQICTERQEKFNSTAYKIAFIEKPLSLNKLEKALVNIASQVAESYTHIQNLEV